MFDSWRHCLLRYVTDCHGDRINRKLIDDVTARFVLTSAEAPSFTNSHTLRWLMTLSARYPIYRRWSVDGCRVGVSLRVPQTSVQPFHATEKNGSAIADLHIVLMRINQSIIWSIDTAILYDRQCLYGTCVVLLRCAIAEPPSYRGCAAL